jgi:NADH:ubiquinone oxidoreductase subunit 3 (subunit A)
MFIEYFIIFIFLFIAIFLALILYCFSFFVILKNVDIEKISIYECGFDPFEDSRNKFEVKFYLVALLFIIFDLEISFLFP